MPYVGSDVLASALAMHKRVARGLFERAGLPVAKGIAVSRAEGDARAAAERARREVGERLVVKPSSHGSAIGVTPLEAAAPVEDVARAIDEVWAIDDFAVVEHFARGREVTCGVLDLGAAEALPATEILSPKDPFYTYEARYAPGRSIHVCPAQLPPAVLARVQAVAVGRARGARVPGPLARGLRGGGRRGPGGGHAAGGEHAAGHDRDEPLPGGGRHPRSPDAEVVRCPGHPRTRPGPGRRLRPLPLPL